MNFKSRLKLLLSIIFVLIICGVLVVYVNYSESTVGSTEASLQLNTYTVGSEYDGIMTVQDVSAGDQVAKGEPLFEIRSDILSQEISSGEVQASNLSYKLDPKNNALIFTAAQSGIVTELDYGQGSFVTAGKVIAVIANTSKATVTANFYLSNPQYDRLSPSTPVTVHLAGNKLTAATIAGISQYSQAGHTVTSIKLTLDHLNNNETEYDADAPVSASLQLNPHPMYAQIERYTKTEMHSI
jgi:multidrug resistance efflux pump